jgi:hypothetical protein
MGVFAFLAILAAGARFAVTPPVPQASRPAGSAGEYLPVEFKVTDFSCREFAEQPDAKDPARRGEIFTLIDRYLHGPSDTAKPEVGALPAGFHFVIATVPDPLHTHLNLNFDRLIDALQQAAQDDGYTYDSSWLPWKERAAEYSSREDKIAEEKDTVGRQLCPGLIIFRKSVQPTAEPPNDDPYAQGLFLFLVAEKPTTGINRVQWNNALEWIDQHKDKKDKKDFDGALRVMGPTFSGSVPSVARALAEVGKQKHFTNVLLYTTIRSCSAYQWLTHLRSDVPVRAADFNENDVTEIDRYFRYLQNQGHSLVEVAILSEDETAYGGLPDTHADEKTDGYDKQKPLPDTHMNDSTNGDDNPPRTCDPGYPLNNRPLHLYYPRDISALRSAYQEQSIFASTSDSSGAARTVLQPQASTSTHKDTDTVATFSGPNSALAQEAQMYGIVDSLRTHGIRFVILRSTNTLDYLFLTRFLHRAYAGAFIVTMGPDILFGREIDSTEFRGVAALSAFPLLPRGQDWTALTNPPPRHAHRVFGNATMEAAYLATRFLITDPPTDRSEKPPYIHPISPKADIPDYGPPIWESNPKGPGNQPQPSTPSTWLSVIGRGGYWPLAVLKEPFNSDPKHIPLQSNLAWVLATKDDAAKPSDGDNTTLKFSLSPAWKLCCVLAILAFALHFFACRAGYNYQNLSMFVQFTPLSGTRQLILMSIGWATIGSVVILMFLCTLRIGRHPYLDPKDFLWIVILAIVGSLAILGAAWDVGWRSCHDPGSPRMHMRPAIIWIALPLLLLLALICAGLTILDYSHPNGIPTAFRAVHLTSGVSPMVSLLLLLSGFYWWFWQTLSGLALLGEGCPILPSRRNLPAGLARISDDMAKNIEEFATPLPSIRFRRGFFYLLPLALLLLQTCALLTNSGLNLETLLHSFENTAFNRMLHVMLAIAFCVLVLECSQLLATWLALKRLLLALNRTPLRRTFMALQGLSMNSLWNMSGTSSRARYSVFSHQLESLHHLRNVLEALGRRKLGDEGILKAVQTACEQGRRFLEKRCTSADLAMIADEDGRLIREDFSRCTEKLLEGLIVNWCAETGTLDLTERGDKAGNTTILPLSKDEPIRRAEEFVCLVYVGYLQNLLARMRTMVLSILGVFAAAAFSLAFYPYVPRPAIVLSLLCLLLVIGSVVALVYAGLARDETLSHLTNTEPGALGLDFWLRLASFIGVPAMGLIAAQFPGITDFIVSWIEPSLNAAK